MGKLASLSSGLLARKGQARPAMRPQGFPGYTQPLDDLGWNDMGAAAVPQPVPAAMSVSDPQPVPPVLVERAALTARLDPPAAADTPRPISAATARRIKRDTLGDHQGGGKAAFTLRLDAARHLRLRLASATTGRSSQALMIDALDMLIAGMPEVDRLVGHLERDGGR